MSVIVTYFDDELRCGEYDFEIREENDSDDGGYLSLRVHPWARYRGPERTDREVFVSVGHYNADGSEWVDPSGGEPVWNIIVNREDFVTGILATFPELKRA